MSKIAVTTLALILLAAFAFPEGVDDRYRDAANRIIDAALADSEGMQKLSYLCDRIGHRLSGSAALNHAISWSAAQMTRDGLTDVATPRVKVPHWVRGRETASLVRPIKCPLDILGLGGSIGTPPAGITAQVLPVSNFDELDRHGRAGIAGKIVLFNAPYESYARSVIYRRSGAARASRLAAAAVLVRSITPMSLETPHTGALDYLSDIPPIPAAAVTIEDATLVQRLHDSGNTVITHLEMQAHMEPDAESANVVGEIPGAISPEQVVVLGGHIDSWDVGSGAQDDASGCIAALEAARLIRQLGLKPRRTVGVVFWTNEENGLAGALAYRDWIGAKVKDHVAAIEMDSGAEKPAGFDVSAGEQSDAAVVALSGIARLLEPIGAVSAQRGGAGADIDPLVHAGVPGLGLRTVGTHYFEWHHSRADTVDKVDPGDFRRCIAALAVTAYVLADMPDRFDDRIGRSGP